MIYNEVSHAWDEVYPVAGGMSPVRNVAAQTYSFDTQVLGVFTVVADEGR